MRNPIHVSEILNAKNVVQLDKQTEFHTALNRIQRYYDDLIRMIQEISTQIEEKKNLGVMYGKPSYKGGKYLRIIEGHGQDRKFKYIGSDPDAVRVALEQIERGQQVTILEKLLSEEEAKYKRLIINLDRAI